ncbi:MAG: hypothetical protein ABIJ31_15915, partial [Pseudomonadota bacterium]
GSKSAIFEIVRELSFRDDFDEGVEKKTLIIISDMMHHTSKYSHYKNIIDYKLYSKKPYADEVRANLNLINIKIVYLRRDKLGNVQGKRHLSFWEEYFKDMGAGTVEIRDVR